MELKLISILIAIVEMLQWGVSRGGQRSMHLELLRETIAAALLLRCTAPFLTFSAVHIWR